MEQQGYCGQRRAIVVGASSGIGKEVARLLMADGWMVGIAARREEQLRALQAEAPERVVVRAIDITQPEAVSQLHSLIQELGGMDLYFHASGIGWQNRTLDEDVELRTAETNVIGFMRMIGAAFRYFASLSSITEVGPGVRARGYIAAITSIAGTKGLGPAPAYSATKALQNTYMEALEQQARQRGLNICFTDIRPGFVDTALLSDGFKYPLLMSPEAVAHDIVKSIYRRRHVRVIDWRYRLLTALWRCIPSWVWRRMRL